MQEIEKILFLNLQTGHLFSSSNVDTFVCKINDNLIPNSKCDEVKVPTLIQCLKVVNVVFIIAISLG